MHEFETNVLARFLLCGPQRQRRGLEGGRTGPDGKTTASVTGPPRDRSFRAAPPSIRVSMPGGPTAVRGPACALR